ncbi:uncharacterized protein LOC117175871 [Belonocnema kinseyi]|uniref:uncharacterized protein LOC117175871 n=1 Tax=Belonocnema kinseyi TaxID=2817044 RepID=UPI00143DD820|nr:uncharacterized protein LOC117175871 [Belonocnema kinseyi]
MEDGKYVQVDEKTIILQSNSSEMQPRLTPTGKISYAKTRVYTQRYRKEWEFMSDFKGWLTSVAHEPTRAFCKYCKKDLHAHRLSLLKHMCTMKHQRSALMYHNAMIVKRKDTDKNSMELDENDFSELEDELGEEEEEEEEGGEIEFTVEDDAELEEDSNFPEHKYARDVSDEDVTQKTLLKRIKVEMTQDIKRDKLAEAMAHVHGETLEENPEDVQLNMDVVSETVETSELSEDISHHLAESENPMESIEVEHQIIEEQSSENEELIPQELEYVNSDITRSAPLSRIALPGNKITISAANAKTFLLRSGGKAVTLSSGKGIGTGTPGTQYVLKKFQGKANNNSPANEKKLPQVSISPKPVADNSQSSLAAAEAGTSQAKKVVKAGKPIVCSTVKKPTISTHVLDMGKGLPIGGLQVSLYKLLDGRWTFVNECNTSSAGRCGDLINSEKNALTTGRYKLHFDVDKYFSLRKTETLYPFIEIVFDVKNPVVAYHIPILLSPFGYTTYRGSDR